MPIDEQNTIDRILAGEQKVFETLFTQHYPIMYAIARNIAGEAVADEVIQEAWISALNNLAKFEGRSSLKSWLLTIVANEAKTRRRKDARLVSLEDMQESWATDPRFDSHSHWQNPSANWHQDSPEALLTAEELKNCIEKNLAKLPENQLVAMQMRDSGGLSLEEICNILAVSPSNVRVLLHRARDKVLQVIDHFQTTGEC